MNASLNALLRRLLDETRVAALATLDANKDGQLTPDEYRPAGMGRG